MTKLSLVQSVNVVSFGGQLQSAYLRAGKTSLWARYCTIVALQKPKSLIRVWGITRLRVKQLLFQEFVDVAARHRIPVHTHETELSIKFDNGSEIRLVGADKDQSIQRKRGDKTQMEVVLYSPN